MEDCNDYVDVPALFDNLLEILSRLMKSIMAERRYNKQATVLGGLSAYLLVIQGEKEELELEVMRELELICTWPKRSIDTSNTTTLKALSAAKHTNSHSDVYETVSTSLHAFAFATPRQREACKQFAKARTSAHVEASRHTHNSRVAQPAKHSVTPEDYPNFVNVTLYDTLREYTRCHCRLAGKATSIEHEARLCLRSRVHVDQGLVDFDLHFWNLPYWDLTKQDCHWQQLRLHVPSKRTRLKRVRVQGMKACVVVSPQKSTTHSAPNGGPEPLQVDDDALSTDDFCGLLSKSIGPAKIRLKLQESSLLRLHEAGETDQELIDKPSVSLAQVLHQHRLSTKMKISLAYTLARSVWQYYDSDWMGSGWTCKTIHLMLESSTDLKYSCVDASKPCFTVQFHTNTDTITECYEIPQVIHRYPRVLALGMLLTDIARTSYDEGVAAVAQTQQHKSNTDYMTGRRIIERDQSWPDLGTADAARQRLREIYKAATQSCFDKDIFRDVSSSARSKDRGFEAEEHRKILYERVVWPLEDIIADMGWTHSLGKLDAIKFDEAIAHNSRLPQRSSSAPPSEDTSRLLVPGRRSVRKGSLQLQQQDNSARFNAALFDDEMPHGGHTSERRKAYLDWKTGFSQVYDHFILEQPPKSVLPVKIAILDTGLDMDHDCIEAHAERIQGKNWLSKPRSKSLHDSHGHGTHITGIILDLIPHSELFVAKVTNGEATDPGALARAIDHAVDENVDIISISIGFPQKVPGYDELERAIERAYSAHVLIFAAASNGGNNNDRAYPARDTHVFCIHSTDAKGNRSKFSPTAEDFTYNFATIGESVESFWPKHLCKQDEHAVRVKSGTSFATPIAASIAAFLLLYARVNLEAEQANRLKRHPAMGQLLHQVSGSSRAKKDRDDYQYIFLSRHPDTFFGRDTEEINNAFRKCT